MKLFKKLHEALDTAEAKLTQLQYLALNKQIKLLKSENTPLDVKLLILPRVWEALPTKPNDQSFKSLSKSFTHNFVVRTTSNQEELLTLLRENPTLAKEYFQDPFKVNYA